MPLRAARASGPAVTRLFLTPWFGVGLTLAVLGFGNWYTGLDKTREYEGLLKAHSQAPVSGGIEEFHALTPRMNRTLLRPLQRSGGGFSKAMGKLDFYRLVRTGGEMMMLTGLFMAVVAAIHMAYRRRSAGAIT